jgi:hypothetical protein
MRKVALIGVGLALGFSATKAATPPIDPQAVLAHIKVLSADDLQGRANGAAGLERAADYIAAEFKGAGLQPPDGPNGFFQPFEIVAGLAIGTGNELVLRGGGYTVRLALGASYMPLAVTPNDSPREPSIDLDNVPLVFAGYGLVAAAQKYDDYAGLDVSGKAVLIFSHEPQENRGDSRLNGSRPLRETSLHAKALAARNRGARALIVVSDPTHRVDQVNYKVFPLEPDAEDHAIPVLRVARTSLAPLLQAWDLDRVAALIDTDLKPRSRALTGATVDYSEFLSRNRRTIRNVVGVVRGVDAERTDEAVVLGAHYDHVGFGGRFSAAPEMTGEVHNGADDNASGVAGIIEAARAAAADRTRFPRSLVFVAFAGEERGLFGSAHYAANPVVRDTVAMINLDMVGRSNGRLEVGGLVAAPSLSEDVNAAAKAAGGIEVRRSSIGAGRSDDASFLDKNIPSLHLFTGFHDDYHRPSDDWPKIDAPGTARVATVAVELAARIAAKRERPPLLNR